MKFNAFSLMQRILIYSVGLLLISASSCKTVQHLADTDVDYNSVTKDNYSLGNIEALIAPYRDVLQEEMAEVIGEMPEELYKRKPNSNLGNWFADILQVQAEKYFDQPIAFAMQNYGGMRVPGIAKGPLTVGQIFELMPFDNNLVVLDMTGDVVQVFLNSIAGRKGCPISHSLKFTMKNGIASEIFIHNQPLDLTKVYKVALPDYVAMGGDQSSFLKNLPFSDSNIKIREAVVENLKTQKDAGIPIIIDSSKRIF